MAFLEQRVRVLGEGAELHSDVKKEEDGEAVHVQRGEEEAAAAGGGGGKEKGKREEAKEARQARRERTWQEGGRDSHVRIAMATSSTTSSTPGRCFISARLQGAGNICGGLTLGNAHIKVYQIE